MTTTTPIPGPPLDEQAAALHQARAVVAAQLRRIAPHIDVGDLDRRLPLREEADLGPRDRAALRRDIEAVTGLPLPADVLAPDASIEEVAQALAWSALVNRWRVTIEFEAEEGFGTRATAVLRAGLDEIEAAGEARKNPSDPFVVDVGHQVAAARALTELARKLLDVASTRIAEWDDDAAPLAS